MIEIRIIRELDYDRIWEILQTIVSKGEVFTYSPSISKEEMIFYWCSRDKHTYVAIENGEIIGTFFIQDNQPGLGSHIANAAYAVDERKTGRGIGECMGEFSLAEAKRLGYLGMQFNIVVKSNEMAIKLWKKLGFTIIGEIPDAFNHLTKGFTNAYIMYRKLT